MFKIAICDDNDINLRYIRQQVEQYCEKEKVRVVLDCFIDSMLLADKIEEKKGYDVYILDIEMPNISGIELLKTIQIYSETSYVIFLTAYEKYAIQGYGVNVVDYIMKERMAIELPDTLSKVFERLRKWENGKVFVISNQRKYIKIPHREIIYIYKNQKNAIFVLKDHQKEWDRKTLQEVYSELDNPHMFFLDRSLIVNTEHIRRIKDDVIEMIEECRLMTTRKHILELKNFLTEI